MRTSTPAEGETVEVVEGVHLTELVVGDRMSAQHFHIEPGARVPEHSHEHEQVGVVTGGTMTIIVDGESYVVGPGESYVVPGDEPHAAENQQDVPLQGIDVFSPPREDPNWKD